MRSQVEARTVTLWNEVHDMHNAMNEHVRTHTYKRLERNDTRTTCIETGYRQRLDVGLAKAPVELLDQTGDLVEGVTRDGLLPLHAVDLDGLLPLAEGCLRSDNPHNTNIKDTHYGTWDLSSLGI